MSEKRGTSLKDIERELRGIRGAVDESWSRLVISGMWRGAGFVLGSVVAIAVASWLLSLFGVVPGFGEMAENLKRILDARGI